MRTYFIPWVASMYVCVCKAVTDRQIHRAVENGASTLRELAQDLGVATQCGKCAKCAHSVLCEAKAQQQSSRQTVLLQPMGARLPLAA